MQLKDTVTSVGTSNKLKDLGVITPSFCARDYRGSAEDALDAFIGGGQEFCEDNVNCYTTDETLDALPQYILKDGYSLELQIIRSSAWRFGYGDPSSKGSIVYTANSGDTLAEASGKFRIFLIESGYAAARV